MNRIPLSEKQISKQIVDYLKIMHIPVFRNNVGATRFINKDGSERYVNFGEMGMPDYLIIIFHNSLPLAGYIEVKRIGGKQTIKQKQFQQWCIKNNILYILAFSVEDVQEGLKAYQQKLV